MNDKFGDKGKKEQTKFQKKELSLPNYSANFGKTVKKQ
jgi:hypothetical protein